MRTLSATFGRVFEASTLEAPLLGLDGSEVVSSYKEAGALLFRVFAVDLPSFLEFTDRFTTDYVNNANPGSKRELVSPDGSTQTVDSGTAPLAPHSEMAYSPFRPDLVWFWCENPPLSGEGQTLLCDGCDMWSSLAGETQEIFRNNRISYRHQMDATDLATWSGKASAAEALELLAGNSNVKHEVNADGTISLAYTIPAAQPPKHRSAPAFANSVIVTPDCTFEDGSPITRDLRLELFQVGVECSLYHEWRKGDVLMIDNSRLMHGRASFRDTSRRILVRYGRERFQ